MRAYGYLSLTRSRLRAHPWHELMAATGIAIGVALTVAVLLANSSIGSSSKEIVRGVTGTANLQVQARSSAGTEGAELLRDIRAVAGVERAAGVLEQHGVLIGPGGAELSVNVVGVDPGLASLSGGLTRTFAAGALSISRGVVLPTATARALGIATAPGEEPQELPTIRVEMRGSAAEVHVAAVFGAEVLGPIADARAAVMSVAQLRSLARLPGRLTRVLVQTAPAEEAAVRSRLDALAADQLTVTDVGADPRALDAALKPTAQATSFFAIVASLLGFLLAFNAVLLSAPERRRWLADQIALNGAPPQTIALLVVLQSLALGLVGSALGVGLGLLLADGLLHESADYLAPAFTLGSRTVVSPLPVLVGAGAGLLACLLAAAPLLLDLRRARPLESVFASDEEPGTAIRRATTLRLLAAGLTLTLGALAILEFAPAAALLACGLLALATVLTVPATFLAIVTAAGRIERRSSRGLVLLSFALRELRATSLRSLALASTGAVAVFGAVAIGGARQDLLRGIDQYVTDYVGTADLWIVHAVDNQATNSFPLDRGMAERLAGVAGVAAVRSYHGGFLDLGGDRRVWVVARDGGDPSLVPPSQVRDGDAATADARIRGRGWASVSDKLADELGAAEGETITLRTPSGPHAIRVAATTSNLGWPLGAIVMNAEDYRAWWGTDDPSAIQVDLAVGASPTAVSGELRQRLGGPASGLRVQTAEQRAAGIRASARSGLSRLGQISTLLLVAACLSMAAALGAAIWQRRPRLSEHALVLGMVPGEQWRALLIESGLVVGAGCLTGAIFGVLGQVVIDSYLVGVTGFPVDLQITAWPTVTTFLLVVGSALLVVAIPGWFAARVGAELALDE